MKQVLLVAGHFALFLLFVAIFFGGQLLGPFHMDPFPMRLFVSHPTQMTVRYFVPTGLILTSALYVLVLGIEVASRSLRTAGLWTTVAFVLALICGFACQFGFITTSLY